MPCAISMPCPSRLLQSRQRFLTFLQFIISPWLVLHILYSSTHCQCFAHSFFFASQRSNNLASSSSSNRICTPPLHIVGFVILWRCPALPSAEEHRRTGLLRPLSTLFHLLHELHDFSPCFFCQIQGDCWVDAVASYFCLLPCTISNLFSNSHSFNLGKAASNFFNSSFFQGLSSTNTAHFRHTANRSSPIFIVMLWPGRLLDVFAAADVTADTKAS